MNHKLIQAIKLLLACISLYLCYFQYMHGNYQYVIYWSLVAVYWILNYITGIKKGV